MATVPYNPVSTAEPIPSGRDQVRLDVQPSMFGANVGAALKGLGSSEEQVGGELFQRAIALKDLDNEAKAREAQTNYATQTAMLQANFDSLEGKDKVDALPQHLKALQDLRLKIRGDLGTMNAQRMYDSDTLPFMQRNIFSSATQSGDANKKYILGTVTSQDKLQDQQWTDPTDENEFRQKLAAKQRNTPTALRLMGIPAGSPQAQLYDFQQKSDLMIGRATALAVKDTNAALTFLEANKDSMDIGKYDALYKQTLDRNLGVGATALADSVRQSHPDWTMEQQEAEIRKQAPQFAHDDPRFVDAALRKAHGDEANERAFQQADTRTTQQMIYAKVAQNPNITTPEIVNDPDLQGRIGAMNPKDRADITSGKFIVDAKKRVTQEQQEYVMRDMTGKAYGTPQQVEEFLDTNPLKLGLDQPKVNQLLALRSKIMKQEGGDPGLNAALSVMRTDFGLRMEALGLTRSNPSYPFDPDAYIQFKGALSQAVDEWRQENQRPPTRDEINKYIGPNILKTVNEGGNAWTRNAPTWLGGANTHRMFQVTEDEVAKWAQTNDAGQKFTQEYFDRMGKFPEFEDLRNLYFRQQFLDLYKNEKSSGTAGPGPTIPQSR